MVAELVGHVIGVDTHTDTHTGAVVHAATGALRAPFGPGGRRARDALARTRLAAPETGPQRCRPC